MRGRPYPRLVARFALISLVAFVAIGGVLAVLFTRQVRAQQERAAHAHAVFVTDSILRYELTSDDLRAPVPASSQRGQALLKFTRTRILEAPVDRVKIWRRDGTIVFSDVPALIGRHFAPDGELREAFAGVAAGGVTDLQDPENIYERKIAPKLLASYVPLYLTPGKDTGRPDAVVEIYTDYGGIQLQIDKVFRTLGLSMLAGLLALYMLMLPIVIRVSRTMSKQNQRLGEQTNRLIDHLQREKESVTKLTELNRLKDNFVAVASHELRSPLTSIIGYVKTLQRPDFHHDDGTRIEFLMAAERQADRLLGLVENLLATAQLEEGDRRLSLAPVSIAQLATECVEVLGARKERVQLAISPQLPDIVTDFQSLQLVLTNLLANAIKFSPNGTPCQLGARLEGATVVLWVRDEGVGIEPDEMSQIFHRFYQADSSATRRYGGVGLGLSLVKELVDILGGSIDVKSTAGHGSTFTVTLPLVHPEAGSASHAPQDDTAAQAPDVVYAVPAIASRSFPA